MVERLLSEKKDPDVILLGIPYDRTSSYGKGADKGPEAIFESFNVQLELYERHTKWSPAKKLSIKNVLLPDINNDLLPQDMASEVSKNLLSYLKDGKFVITLGGEHSIGSGISDAWSKMRDPKKVSVIQIDAHMDLRDDDSDYNEDPSRFAHSCVSRRCVELGFPLIQVGIRAYAEFELEAAKKHSVSVFEWPRTESTSLIEEIMRSIKTEEVYITLDVDGIDPAHMPATGTPVQGGLSWKFTFDLLAALFRQKKVVGADIVEVAPREGDGLTEYGAAQLAYYMIALKFEKTHK